MIRRTALAVLGARADPTSALLSDLQHLGYRPELLAWPAPELRWTSPPPLATLLDLRAITLDVARACHEVREHRALKRAPLVAVVPEHEAPRLDLALGFDDLILAPYRPTELAARLRLLAWRAESATAPGVIRLGRLALDEATYEVRLDGLPLDLTLKEYQLFLFLVQNPRRVFTREELLDRVWGHDYYGGTRTVDVHVRRIRAKTEEAGEFIETVRGVGYRLVGNRESGVGDRD
jgi:DNA-binding response OmpR family regulator